MILEAQHKSGADKEQSCCGLPTVALHDAKSWAEGSISVTPQAVELRIASANTAAMIL